jgi:hypothetical protein
MKVFENILNYLLHINHQKFKFPTGKCFYLW